MGGSSPRRSRTPRRDRPPGNDEVDWKGEVLEVGAQELPERERQPFDYCYELATDTGRIRRELGYRETIDRNEALRRTIEWELDARAGSSGH